MRVANCEVLQAQLRRLENGVWRCELSVRARDHQLHDCSGEGPTEPAAATAAIAQLCTRPIRLERGDVTHFDDGQTQAEVTLAELGRRARRGLGRCLCDERSLAVTVAALRAASHAGLLRAPFRANHQKTLRGWAHELVDHLLPLLADAPPADDAPRLEAESMVLEYLNLAASAAVVTAANAPRADSILSLFDTSAWLFDRQGRRRDAFTETDLWLAWYPGLNNAEQTVGEVVQSMPAAPDVKIPRIVKLFENPGSWLRFRGAVDLADHDVLHVLLGRGLQDQDEAFVLGFAMGSAKRVGWLERRLFQLVLTRLYPEPYRIPRYLLPAFELGVACGQATGVRDLYRRPLKQLEHLPLAAARRDLGIDVSVLRSFYEQERQLIPFTIASLRLP